MPLVKNELPELKWGMFERAGKYTIGRKMSPKEITMQYPAWTAVEYYQYGNPEQNIIRVYFLIEKGVVLEDPSTQLNLRGLIGWDKASKGNHINHITAGTGNSWERLHSPKRKSPPHNYSQCSCSKRDVGLNTRRNS